MFDLLPFVVVIFCCGLICWIKHHGTGPIEHWSYSGGYHAGSDRTDLEMDHELRFRSFKCFDRLFGGEPEPAGRSAICFSFSFNRLIWLISPAENIFLAVAGIPKSSWCAEIEGANAATTFFRITLPMLSPTIFFVSLMEVTGYFKSLILSTMIRLKQRYACRRRLVSYFYEEAFIRNNKGYGLYPVVLFSIIFIITLFQLKMQKKWGYTESWFMRNYNEIPGSNWLTPDSPARCWGYLCSLLWRIRQHHSKHTKKVSASRDFFPGHWNLTTIVPSGINSPSSLLYQTFHFMVLLMGRWTFISSRPPTRLQRDLPFRNAILFLLSLMMMPGNLPYPQYDLWLSRANIRSLRSFCPAVHVFSVFMLRHFSDPAPELDVAPKLTVAVSWIYSDLAAPRQTGPLSMAIFFPYQPG